MNKAFNAARLLLIIGLTCMSPSIADDKSTPEEWQKQSLKGITSLRYGVAEGACYKTANDDVASALSKVKVPTKKLANLKADYAKPLSVTEGRVKVVASDREDNQCWVGLSVDQRCQLKRTPSINLDRETYQIGKMCPKADATKTVEELCAQFVKDFGVNK